VNRPRSWFAPANLRRVLTCWPARLVRMKFDEFPETLTGCPLQTHHPRSTRRTAVYAAAIRKAALRAFLPLATYADRRCVRSLHDPRLSADWS